MVVIVLIVIKLGIIGIFKFFILVIIFKGVVRFIFVWDKFWIIFWVINILIIVVDMYNI